MRHDRILIESALKPLLGLPLWGSHRAADLQVFKFGRKRETVSRLGPRKGSVAVVGELALHVQCGWRLVGPSGIWAASRDLHVPAGDPDAEPPGWDWMKMGANRRDERVASWFASDPKIVEETRADELGSIQLVLSEGCALEVFPDDSLDHEHWRLLRPDVETPHFVVTGAGIE